MNVLYVSDSLGARHPRRGIFYFSGALTAALAKCNHRVTLAVERTRSQRALSSSGARLDRIGGFSRSRLELLQIYRRLTAEDDYKLESKKEFSARLLLNRAAARVVPLFSIDVLVSLLCAPFGKRRRGIVIDNDADVFDYVPKDLAYLKPFASFLSIPSVYSYQTLSGYFGIASQCIDARNFDLVIVDTPQRISLKRSKNSRLITVVHDLLPLTDIKLQDGATRLYARRLADTIASGSEIVFVSNYTRQRCLRLMPALGKLKSRVVHPRTVFPERPAEHVASAMGNYFVIVVSDEYRKNLEFVLSFFRSAQELRLVVLGRSSRALRYEYRDCSNIEFTGWCSEERKAAHFSQAAGIIVPSLAEGFGIPIIEGLRHGTPVLCSRIPVFEEVGREFCVYFDPYAPEDLRRAIEYALSEQQALRGLIADNFDALKQRFSLDTLAEAVLDLEEAPQDVSPAVKREMAFQS